MTDAVDMTNERNQMFYDLFNGKTPKRVPISIPATPDFAIQYSGLDLAECQWDLTKLEPVYDKFCQDFITDTYPGGFIRIPSHYQILGSTPIVMSSSGFMQHPEVVGLLAEEYDQFIASPYDCIVETILPRLYTELNGEPGKVAMTLAKAMRAHSDDLAYLGTIRAKMNAKYGYATMGAVLTEAPFDFMADFLRSFKGISGDVRRYPDKVVAACEAVLPLMIKKGTLPDPTMLGYTIIPLHMAPYLRDKDFATLYWPTFKKLVETLAGMGQNIQLFVEHDWMRFLDHLYELPENTIMRFEYGDAKLVKEKLGKKHIISGFYPVIMLQTGTKQQCVDKAKELLEILAPGGRYWWQADKSIINLEANGPVVENLRAVLEYVHENGTY